MWFGNQYSEVLSIKFVELLLLVSDCCSAPILLQYGIAALLRNFTYCIDSKAPHTDTVMSCHAINLEEIFLSTGWPLTNQEMLDIEEYFLLF